MRALRIPTDESEPITALEVFQLEDYQAAVGGWIEPVDIPTLGVTIYVHEDGLMLNLPFNARATFLWWHSVPAARQKAMLVGPVLVVGLPDRNGDSTSVPVGVTTMLTEPSPWRVEAHVPGIQEWYASQQTHGDYLEALMYAMVVLEHWEEVDDVRVVAVASDALTGGATTEPDA